MVISRTDEHTFAASSFLCTPPSEPLCVFCDTLTALIFIRRRAAKNEEMSFLGTLCGPIPSGNKELCMRRTEINSGASSLAISLSLFQSIS